MHYLKRYVEEQADRVEALLAAHRVPGRVTGGTVGPVVIRMILQTAPHIRYKGVERLVDDLALALHVSDLRILRSKEGIVLEFANPEPRAVRFSQVLADVQPLPIASALLGMCSDGAPLAVRLSSPDVSHVLVAGTTGAGKSVLLSTFVTSLIATHTEKTMRLLLIDPKNKFGVFGASALLTRPPIADVDEAIGALRDVMRVVEVRDARGEYPPAVPRIVVFIDELADLVVVGGGEVAEIVARVAGRGREAGVHLVVATQHPAAAILGNVMRANFPLRLVGKVVSANDARVAAGCGGTNAHTLEGRGDFVAVGGGSAEPVRFKVIQVQGDEISALCRPAKSVGGIGLTPASLAAPVFVRPVEEEPRDRVQEAVDMLRPHWPELREAWLAGERGVKTRLVRMVWPGHRAEGSFTGWIDQAVEILEGPGTDLAIQGGGAWQTG